MVLDNAVPIRDKMQVIYREMTLDGVKSNDRWNAIQALVKIARCSWRAMIGYLLIGL